MKTTVKKTKNKKNYLLPSVKVTEVEMEGCIAASMILVEPDADNFDKYKRDDQTPTGSQDIEFLL